MGLLASGAAHELGTPLATLSVILNDWRRLPQFARDPDFAQEIAEMLGQIDRCKAIVTGILMSSGEARGEAPTHTTVNRFVDEMVEEWRSHRSPPILAYDNRFAPDATIVADSVLKQIVFNLFDNAIEASPGWIGITVEREANHLVIVVTDRGRGLRTRNPGRVRKALSLDEAAAGRWPRALPRGQCHAQAGRRGRRGQPPARRCASPGSQPAARASDRGGAPWLRP